ncbi:hypothetical protein M0R45_018980 [Rubus argutus]|uniref:BED-type domain-containing protein n=1 Tax=Rubus argutus TaxID=59490 RepID=A0AAW1X5X0_RUBAR
MEEAAQQQFDDEGQPANAIGTQACSAGTQVASITPTSMASENNQTNNPDTPIEVEVEVTTEALQGKLKSAVWRHFSRELKDGVILAKCPDCKKELQGGSNYGTTHLRNHMKSCLYKKQKKIGQCTLNAGKSGDGSIILGTYQFDQNRSRKELAKMIIMHEYPLAMVGHRGFRSFLFSVNPSFKIVTRNTIKNDILNMFEYEKEKCMKLLDANKSRIAITTDMWTSSNKKRGFMAITSHFIDDSWKLQSRLIRFIYVSCPHTAEILERELMECLYDWNLDDCDDFENFEDYDVFMKDGSAHEESDISSGTSEANIFVPENISLYE